MIVGILTHMLCGRGKSGKGVLRHARVLLRLTRIMLKPLLISESYTGQGFGDMKE